MDTIKDSLVDSIPVKEDIKDFEINADELSDSARKYYNRAIKN